MSVVIRNMQRNAPVFSPLHNEQTSLLQSLFEAMMEVEHEADRFALATIGHGLANQWRQAELTPDV